VNAPSFPAESLRLRAMDRGDRALFVRLYTDAGTMRYIAPALARGEAAASFRATLAAMQRPRGARFFAVVASRDKRAIGLCSIQKIDRRERAAELGIMLEADACGRRLGREAMRLLMAIAFETLSIDTIWVQYRSANVAAARLFAALGFVARSATRPRMARPAQRVRFMQRSAWQAP